MTKPLNRSPDEWVFDDIKVETINPHTKLGMAVLAQAVWDCCDQRPGTRGTVFSDTGRKGGQIADSARAFLSMPNEQLTFWCEVAGIDPGYVISSYWTRLRRPNYGWIAS
jgi:hypothetical protein